MSIINSSYNFLYFYWRKRKILRDKRKKISKFKIKFFFPSSFETVFKLIKITKIIFNFIYLLQPSRYNFLFFNIFVTLNTYMWVFCLLNTWFLHSRSNHGPVYIHIYTHVRNSELLLTSHTRLTKTIAVAFVLDS